MSARSFRRLINRGANAIFAVCRFDAAALALVQQHDGPNWRNAPVTLPFAEEVRRGSLANGRAYDIKGRILSPELIENPKHRSGVGLFVQPVKKFYLHSEK